MTQPPLLEIKNLSVHFRVYGGTLKVLDDVSLTVYPGEKVGLVGETGCGKTTAMKTVLRVVPTPPAVITAGEILFKGRDVLKMKQRELVDMRGQGISMIFQDPSAALNPVFTIGEQIEAAIRYSSARSRRYAKAELRERARRALADVALADPDRLLESYPVQLSGGMRQRVCIGMALSTEPELLIADEPGTALDVTIQDQVLRLLHRMVEQRHKSIILITHTLGIVRQTTDRVYVMYAGTIVEVAPTPRLFAAPSHPYTQGLMAAVPRLFGGGITDGIPGRIPNYMDPPTGCRFHTRCPHMMPVCKRQKPPLFPVAGDAGHLAACFLHDDPAQVQTYQSEKEAV
jgi:peptide/nickel transport system ATP-binding protein